MNIADLRCDISGYAVNFFIVIFSYLQHEFVLIWPPVTKTITSDSRYYTLLIFPTQGMVQNEFSIFFGIFPNMSSTAQHFHNACMLRNTR